MDTAIIKAKRIECFIGLFLLLPPILGVIAFLYNPQALQEYFLPSGRDLHSISLLVKNPSII